MSIVTTETHLRKFRRVFDADEVRHMLANIVANQAGVDLQSAAVTVLTEATNGGWHVTLRVDLLKQKQEEEQPAPFRAGDIVRCIDALDTAALIEGLDYTVDAAHGESIHLLETALWYCHSRFRHAGDAAKCA